MLSEPPAQLLTRPRAQPRVVVVCHVFVTNYFLEYFDVHIDIAGLADGKILIRIVFTGDGVDCFVCLVRGYLSQMNEWYRHLSLGFHVLFYIGCDDNLPRKRVSPRGTRGRRTAACPPCTAPRCTRTRCGWSCRTGPPRTVCSCTSASKSCIRIASEGS